MIIMLSYYGLLTIILLFMVARLVRSLYRFRIRKNYTAALSAPSVSICIPARNETHAMTQCLERALASDYPKLEVIVYDDSSVDDTSILIRSFAHAGVRFVPGVALPDGWVGKNHALQALALEASGTYVVFMDVDTAIEPTTISQLVGYMIDEKVVMASVIPNRADIWRLSVWLGHLRYFWQLVFSRRAAPASSSALWMVERATLLDTLHGFEPYKATVAPEAQMAARLGTRLYHCLVGTPSLGVSYEKKWRSQVETSRRMLYPSVGDRWWVVVAAPLFVCALILPSVHIVSALWFGWSGLGWLAVGYQVALMGLYGIYTHATWQRSWWLGALCWPVVIAQELILLIASYWGYARGTITWKGRLLTAPTLRVSSLKIDR